MCLYSEVPWIVFSQIRILFTKCGWRNCGRGQLIMINYFLFKYCQDISLWKTRKKLKSIILSNYIKDKSSVCNTQELRYDEIIEIHEWNIGKRQQINELFYPLPVTERMILRNSPFCETTLFETMDIKKIWMKSEVQGSERHIPVYPLERIREPDQETTRDYLRHKFRANMMSQAKVDYGHSEVFFMTITSTWQKSSL